MMDEFVDSAAEAVPPDMGEPVDQPPAVEAPTVDLPSESAAEEVPEEVPEESQPEAPASEDDAESVSDVVDSFLAGVLAGVSADGEGDTGPSDEPDAAALDGPLKFVGVETFALSPVTSSSGLKGVLLDVIGPYDNIVTQFKYQSYSSSNYSYVNEITPDYPWIASAVLFVTLLLSVFRLIGRAFLWRP